MNDICIQKNKVDSMNLDKMEEDDNVAELLLKEWGLETYTQLLVEDKGYDNVDDCKYLNVDKLMEIGFRQGHSERFERKLIYFKTTDVDIHDESKINNDAIQSQNEEDESSQTPRHVSQQYLIVAAKLFFICLL